MEMQDTIISLACESEQERAQWMEAIEQAASYSRSKELARLDALSCLDGNHDTVLCDAAIPKC